MNCNLYSKWVPTEASSPQIPFTNCLIKLPVVSVCLGNNFCTGREIKLHRFTFIGSDCQIIVTTFHVFTTQLREMW